jgi:hypothetical protein
MLKSLHVVIAFDAVSVNIPNGSGSSASPLRLVDCTRCHRPDCPCRLPIWGAGLRDRQLHGRPALFARLHHIDHQEETTGALWYRILAQKCEAGLTLHYVFVTRAQSMISFLVTPAFMSIDYPAPKSVSKQADRWYFIAIEPPLADGTDIVETFIGPSGVPLTVHVFDKGQRRPAR